jgi:hypothetical protein
VWLSAAFWDRIPSKIMTEQEASALYDKGKEAVVAWMLATDQRLRQLEARLGQNSQNSSKPPSSDQPGGNKLKPMANSLRNSTFR